MAWTKRKDIMLCQPLDDKNLTRIFRDAGAVLVQPKLDGERCWVCATASSLNTLSLVSSTGRNIYSVPHIFYAVRSFLAFAGAPYPLDGELYAHGKSFEEIASIVSRTANIHEDYTSLRYHVFDIKTRDAQADRITKLQADLLRWSAQEPEWADCIVSVPTELCLTVEEVHEAYSKYCGQGYEGIIVRHPLAPYKIGRPWYILKFKPKREDVYAYVGMEEAISADGSAFGRTGAIICSDAEGQEFKVGPGVGMSHRQLEDMWANRSHYASAPHSVRVQYQNLTETGGVPRFGKFIDIYPE